MNRKHDRTQNDGDTGVVRKATTAGLAGLVVAASSADPSGALSEPGRTSVDPALIQQQERWTSIGLGGGGGFWHAGASPHEPELILVSSDMGGVYRTENGGESWHMLDWRLGTTKCGDPVFHPIDPTRIYVTSWQSMDDTFKISSDRGVTWQSVDVNGPWKGDRLSALTIDRGNPALMLLAGGRGVYRSVDAGKTWQKIEGAPGGLLGIHVDQTSPKAKRIVLAANKDGAHCSGDGGLTWTETSNGLPWRGIRGFSAGSDPKTKRCVAYVTIPSKKDNGQFAGGVFRSVDRGKTWTSIMNAGVNTAIGQHEYGESDIDQYVFLGQAETHPDIIYVTNRGTGYHPPYHYTVYRSDDAGQSWRHCFFTDPRYPPKNTECAWLFWARSRGFGHAARTFRVNAGNPDQAFYTNDAEIFTTTDGGKSWCQVFTRHAPGQGAPSKEQPGRWGSIGIEDTSCWRYVFDPHDTNRTYICYTDIGFARSEDRGQTWYPSDKGIPWNNTIYDLACDPDVPGLLFAACSGQHDIPHWGYIMGATGPGGICMSTDGAKSWRPIMTGFPKQPTPCTAILLDPDSPKTARTLYAGVYGHGVYKSSDGGQSWHDKSRGIVPEQNRQVYSVQRWKDGALFCSVAARRKGRGISEHLSGGLFMSTDGAENWTKISSDEVFRAVDFAVHPDDRRIIYVAAMDGLMHQGGVYKTTDGGQSWTRSVPAYNRKYSSYIEGYSIALHPKNPDLVYFFTNTHGLFISRDAAKTWTECVAPQAPPFLNLQRIYWDPKDSGTVYIVTFGGGVWKGPDPAAN